MAQLTQAMKATYQKSKTQILSSSVEHIQILNSKPESLACEASTVPHTRKLNG